MSGVLEALGRVLGTQAAVALVVLMAKLALALALVVGVGRWAQRYWPVPSV